MKFQETQFGDMNGELIPLTHFIDLEGKQQKKASIESQKSADMRFSYDEEFEFPTDMTREQQLVERGLQLANREQYILSLNKIKELTSNIPVIIEEVNESSDSSSNSITSSSGSSSSSSSSSSEESKSQEKGSSQERKSKDKGSSEENKSEDQGSSEENKSQD